MVRDGFNDFTVSVMEEPIWVSERLFTDKDSSYLVLARSRHPSHLVGLLWESSLKFSFA